jgi:hypothetical protein
MDSLRQPAPSKFIDDPAAPELYASNFSGIQIAMGNAVITLESARADHSNDAGAINRVVVARVVMPIAIAQSLALQLNALLGPSGLGRLEPTVAAKTQ